MPMDSKSAALEVVTLAERIISPLGPSSAPFPPEQATDALAAMLTMTRPAPSHEHSERAELVRSIRARARVASETAN